MRLRHGMPIVALLLLAALLAGCGGGDSSEASASDASGLSRAEFIAKGDAVCAEANAAVGSVKAPNFIAEAKEITTLYGNMVEELKALGAPEQEKGYAKFAAAAEALGKKEKEAQLAAERKDEEKIGELAGEIGPLVEEFEAAARALGFQRCSEGPTEPPGGGEGSGSEGSEGLEAEVGSPLSEESG